MRFPLFALLAANVLLVLGTGLQAVLLPVRAHLQGFSDQALGLLGAGYYLGFIAGCLATPLLLRRVGHIRTFAVLAVMAAQTFPAHAAMPTVPAWLALRLVGGFCFAGLSMVVESWVNETAGNGDRGRSLSIYLILTAAASVGGQTVLRLTDPMAWTALLVISLCISLSMIPLSLSVAPGPSPIAGVRLDIRKLYRTSPVGLIGCLGVGLANGAFWSLAPLFLQGYGRSPDQVALFMAAAVGGGAVAQWPIGLLSDRFDRRLVLLGGCAAAIVIGMLLGLEGALSWPAELALSAAFGAAAFPLYALSVAHANDHAEPGSFVETSGGLLLTFGIGAAAGPLLASALMAHLSGGLFVFTSAIHLLLGVVVAWRMARRSAVPLMGRPAFVPAHQPAAPLYERRIRRSLRGRAKPAAEPAVARQPAAELAVR